MMHHSIVCDMAGCKAAQLWQFDRLDETAADAVEALRGLGWSVPRLDGPTFCPDHASAPTLAALDAIEVPGLQSGNRGVTDVPHTVTTEVTK